MPFGSYAYFSFFFSYISPSLILPIFPFPAPFLAFLGNACICSFIQSFTCGNFYNKLQSHRSELMGWLVLNQPPLINLFHLLIYYLFHFLLFHFHFFPSYCFFPPLPLSFCHSFGELHPGSMTLTLIYNALLIGQCESFLSLIRSCIRHASIQSFYVNTYFYTSRRQVHLTGYIIICN